MSIQNSICEGCPAAFALGLRADELANSNGFLIDARREETKKARCALENAAGQTACAAIDKQLPELPETVPPTGSNELIEFVSLCPSFARYLELRMAEVQR
jgi:hypothetical protein